MRPISSFCLEKRCRLLHPLFWKEYEATVEKTQRYGRTTEDRVFWQNTLPWGQSELCQKTASGPHTRKGPRSRGSRRKLKVVALVDRFPSPSVDVLSPSVSLIISLCSESPSILPLSLFNALIDTDLFPSIEPVHYIEGKNKGTGGPSVETVRGWFCLPSSLEL